MSWASLQMPPQSKAQSTYTPPASLSTIPLAKTGCSILLARTSPCCASLPRPQTMISPTGGVMSATKVAIRTAALEGSSAGAPLRSSHVEIANTTDNETKQRMFDPFPAVISWIRVPKRLLHRSFQDVLARLDEAPGLLIAAPVGIGLIRADMLCRAVAEGGNRDEGSGRRGLLREQLIFH